MTTGQLSRAAAIVVACTLLAAAVAFLASAAQQQRYEATALVLFGLSRPEFQVLGSQVGDTNADDTRRAAANAVELGSDEVVRRTARALDLTPSEVKDSVEVTPQRDANVVEVRASSSNARGSARLANVYVREYIDLRDEVEAARARGVARSLRSQLPSVRRTDERGLGEAQIREAIGQLDALQKIGSGTARVIQRPIVPTGSAEPKPTRNALFGAGFGLLLGLALASLISRQPRYISD